MTQSANAAVLCKVQQAKQSRALYKTAEQRAAMGRYGSEHGNVATLKKFKVDFEGGQLGESTACMFGVEEGKT